ncbi:hypothetical protein J6590_093482 [Homalodisca vitripennis]|nr:hypothetical protein J6590_093482 [Homalodisca vitripennis]
MTFTNLTPPSLCQVMRFYTRIPSSDPILEKTLAVTRRVQTLPWWNVIAEPAYSSLDLDVISTFLHFRFETISGPNGLIPKSNLDQVNSVQNTDRGHNS